jgi:hypothetical protein
VSQSSLAFATTYCVNAWWLRQTQTKEGATHYEPHVSTISQMAISKW